MDGALLQLARVQLDADEVRPHPVPAPPIETKRLPPVVDDRADDVTEADEALVAAVEEWNRPRRAGGSHRAMAVALCVSLAMHGAALAAGVWLFATHAFTPPRLVFQQGDGGSSDEPAPPSPRIGDDEELHPAIPALASPQAPPQPTARAIFPDDFETPPTPSDTIPSRAVEPVREESWRPIGIVSEMPQLPPRRTIAATRPAQNTELATATAPSAAPDASDAASGNENPSPVGGAAGGVAGESPDGVANGSRAGAGHDSRPPRISGRGGSGMGRRGAATGVDSRGMPIPRYPQESIDRGEQGTVVLEVEFREDGTVGAVKIIDDGGYARLANAAVTAIRAYTFEPATVDGKPAPYTGKLPFVFQLKSQ